MGIDWRSIPLMHQHSLYTFTQLKSADSWHLLEGCKHAEVTWLQICAVYAPQCTEHILSWAAWTTKESALLCNTMAPLVSVTWHASSRWQYIGLERSFSTIAIYLGDDIIVASSGNLFRHVRHVQRLQLAIHAVHICCGMRIVLHNLWSAAGVSHTQDTCWAVTGHILKQCCERVLFEQLSKCMPCAFVPNWTAFLPSLHVDVCQQRSSEWLPGHVWAMIVVACSCFLLTSTQA
jgi:hypothetical protein